MAEANKEKVVNTEQTTSQPETKKKNKIFLYIGIGLFVLLAIGGAIVFFVFKGVFNLGEKALEQGEEWVEEVSEDYEFEEGEDGGDA